MREEYMFYEGRKFIRGDLCGLGVPVYYPNSKPEDWYWEENSKKEDNCFLPSHALGTNSKNWNNPPQQFNS